MAAKRKIPTLIALLMATLISPHIASGELSRPKTRVMGFDLPAGTRIGGSTALTPRTHQGIEHAYGEIASGYVVAARGGAAAEASMIGARIGQVSGAVDPNKLNHIFGNAAHNLAPVVEQFGSQEAAFTALQRATQTAADAASFGARFRAEVPVGNFWVTVQGNLVDGVARIGSAWIP